MAYTKGQLTAQVMDRVQNQINLDNATRKAYVKKYLGACVNYLNTKQYYAQQKDPDGLAEFDSQFVGAMEEVDVNMDEMRNQFYITIPGIRAAYIFGKDIIYIGPAMNQANGYIPVQQNQYRVTARSLGSSSRRYYMIENGTTAFLFNHPSSVSKLYVKRLWNVDEIQDSDPLPITTDQELPLLEMMVQFFLGKRQLPQDTVNNNKDFNQN